MNTGTALALGIGLIGVVALASGGTTQAAKPVEPKPSQPTDPNTRMSRVTVQGRVYTVSRTVVADMDPVVTIMRMGAGDAVSASTTFMPGAGLKPPSSSVWQKISDWVNPNVSTAQGDLERLKLDVVETPTTFGLTREATARKL